MFIGMNKTYVYNIILYYILVYNMTVTEYVVKLYSYVGYDFKK